MRHDQQATRAAEPLRIGIASGKGGTGKTTVATNLARVVARRGWRVAYLDCDVEEPNGHIFLQPEITARRPVEKRVPQVDAAKCAHCGLCGEICQYSAIVCVGDKVLVYPELCHSCGGCMLVCPEGAIAEVPREIGVVETGRAGTIDFAQGRLDVGQPMSPPVIQAVRQVRPPADLVIVDAPPGTSCPVIAAIRRADFVLLVTEPTPFGLHDLKLAVEMVRVLKSPFGVVINRADLGNSQVRDYCESQRIDVLLEIPDDRQLAEAYSRGVLACDALPQYDALFAELWDTLATLNGKRSRGITCPPPRNVAGTEILTAKSPESGNGVGRGWGRG
jgi:MinD superfamily P-loop ATPase